ncbi:hypothetical protein FQZ97_1000510 [compost metagenome]
MLVEAGSHKLVNLRSDNRERQNNTAEHRDLDLREEEFLRCGIDQLGFRAIHPSPVERPLIGNDKQMKRCFAKAKQRIKARKNAKIAQIRRRRSSIRCSSRGAALCSISSSSRFTLCFLSFQSSFSWSSWRECLFSPLLPLLETPFLAQQALQRVQL